VLSSAKEGHISRICRNYLSASVGVKQVRALEVTQVPLAVVAITNETSWRVIRKCLELGSKLPAFTLNFHAVSPSLEQPPERVMAGRSDA
jgi:hypothetical protein